jgi:selenocysteine lyase/cysteine desulfurase
VFPDRSPVKVGAVREAFGERFDVSDGYLNSASIGIPPASAALAVLDAVRDWAGGRAVATDFDAPVATARAAFAALTGFPVERVALGAAASGLVGLIAASATDDLRVLVAEGEFTSVSWPFVAQRAGGPVEVDEAPLEQLADLAPDYDMVAVSVVQSADGRIADLDGLRAAQAGGCRVVLDATQALGWFDADLSWADAVVAAGYKWLLCPRGAAWMAVGPGLDLVPHSAGWWAGQDPWASVYGLPMRLARGARALDVSPVWLSQVGAAVAVPWLAGLDRAAVHAHCVGLADAFRAGLGMPPAGSAIVSVRREGAGARLAAAGLAASTRAGAARLAFALYNTTADVELALAALT